MTGGRAALPEKCAVIMQASILSKIKSGHIGDAVRPGLGECARRTRRSHSDTRTHRSLDKDAPASRPVPVVNLIRLTAGAESRNASVL
jgi:hypothetical protein